MLVLEQKKPLVSVVMPTYNHASFIGMSIESVLNQTYDNLELLIIDNYSSDNTSDIVSMYSNKDERVKYRRFNNNGFIANSRNLGIEISRGEYIAFLDSDDLWLKSKIEMQMPLFDDPAVGLVYCNVDEIDEKGKLIKITTKPVNCYQGYVLPQLLTGEFSVACSSSVIRRSVLKKCKLTFMLNRQGAEDWDLWLRIAESFKFACADETSIRYRVHAGATSRDYEMMFKSAVSALDDLKERMNHMDGDLDIYDNNVLLHSYRSSYLDCLDKYANHLLGDKRYRDVAATMFEMFKLNICSRHAWMMFMKLIIYPVYIGIISRTASMKYMLRKVWTQREVRLRDKEILIVEKNK